MDLLWDIMHDKGWGAVPELCNGEIERRAAEHHKVNWGFCFSWRKVEAAGKSGGASQMEKTLSLLLCFKRQILPASIWDSWWYRKHQYVIICL